MRLFSTGVDRRFWTTRLFAFFLLARDVIYTYISRLCYDVSVRLSVRLSVTEVHCGHGACREHSGCASQRGWSHHTIPNKHGRRRWRCHLTLCSPLLGPVVVIVTDSLCQASLGLFTLFKMIDLPHAGIGTPRNGVHNPEIRTRSIFFVKCTYWPSFIVLCLIIEKLSCWETN